MTARGNLACTRLGAIDRPHRALVMGLNIPTGPDSRDYKTGLSISRTPFMNSIHELCLNGPLSWPLWLEQCLNFHAMYPTIEQNSPAKPETDAISAKQSGNFQYRNQIPVLETFATRPLPTTLLRHRKCSHLLD